MNKVIEATLKDGSRTLLPTSLLHGYADAAKETANGNMKRAMRLFMQMLANLMYVRGYKVLTEICYSVDTQIRTVIIVQA